MATDKAALGRKYTCFSCTCKFYDMKAELAICPRCQADQAEDPNPPMDPALLFRQPRGSRKKKVVEPEPAPVVEAPKPEVAAAEPAADATAKPAADKTKA